MNTKTPDAELKRAKDKARKQADRIRKNIAPEGGEEAAARLADHFLETIALPAPAIVAGYWPIREEISSLTLLRLLHERGQPCALSRLDAEGEPLSFRRWSPGDPLEDGPFDIPQPRAAAPACAPDALLIPLLAFDRQGHRLGYGRGYYDRALAELKAKKTICAVGLAFAVQEVQHVPAASHDIQLDYIATEKACLPIKKTPQNQ